MDESEVRLKRYKSQGLQIARFYCVCQVQRKKCKNDEKCRPPRQDHYEAFRDSRTGERVFTIQLYCGDGISFPLEDLQQIIHDSEEFAAKHGLTVRVSREDSWYYPDWTVLIEYRIEKQK